MTFRIWQNKKPIYVTTSEADYDAKLRQLLSECGIDVEEYLASDPEFDDIDDIIESGIVDIDVSCTLN